MYGGAGLYPSQFLGQSVPKEAESSETTDESEDSGR